MSPVWAIEFEYSLISYFWQYHFGVVYDTLLTDNGYKFGAGESDCIYVPNDQITTLNA